MKFQQKLTYLGPMIVFYNDSYDKSLRRKTEAIKHDHTEAVHNKVSKPKITNLSFELLPLNNYAVTCFYHVYLLS